MSNEEKSKAIAGKRKACYEPYYAPDGWVETSELECYDSAMDMAEWKDAQAVAAYCKCCDTRECEDYESDTCDWLEKFKKLLKGGEK